MCHTIVPTSMATFGHIMDIIADEVPCELINGSHTWNSSIDPSGHIVWPKWKNENENRTMVKIEFLNVAMEWINKNDTPPLLGEDNGPNWVRTFYEKCLFSYNPYFVGEFVARNVECLTRDLWWKLKRLCGCLL